MSYERNTKVLYFFMQIFNTINLVVGLSLAASTLYLSYIIKNLTSFNFSLLLIAIYVTSISLVGFYLIKKSPTALFFYLSSIVAIFILFICSSFFILFDQQNIIDYLIKYLEDSTEAIENLRKIININIEITKYIMLAYISVIVNKKFIFIDFKFCFCLFL